jgi:hypothetical protein
MKRIENSPERREGEYLQEIDLADMERASGGCAACGCQAGGAQQLAGNAASLLSSQQGRR